MDGLIEIGIYAAKVVVIVAAFLVMLSAVASLVFRAKQQRDSLSVEHLNDKWTHYSKLLKARLLNKKDFKALNKTQKKKKKKEQKAPKTKKRLFVLDFDGDIKASANDRLREEITAVLSVANKGDEVVVRLESGGGMVHAYGLGASQLLRIKHNGLHLTVCVDKIAASGGYMMACTAEKLIAAPFAIIGSVGVLAQVPNFHQLLEKNNIRYEEFTAGEFKRTVSLLGEITEKGREKFKEQIEDTHKQFKNFVGEQRPQVEIDKIATGEHWLGSQAKDHKLVDAIQTSDDYVFEKRETHDIYHLELHGKRSLTEKLSEAVSSGADKTLHKLWSELNQSRYS